MYPMIEIKTVPIEIQMKTTRASLEYTRGTAEMEISRSDNGLDIKSRPIKVQMDTFEPRPVAAPIATQPMAQQTPQMTPQAMQQIGAMDAPGRQAAYEATSTYAQHGSLMLNARIGQNMVAQFAQEPVNQQMETETGLDFMPKTGLNIDWEDGSMEIRYEMDKLNFDWKIDKGEFKFTPGDIEISVAQQPDVIIKYTGGPIYVPRSSDPNYEPVDVRA